MQTEFSSILSSRYLLGSCFQEEIFKCPSCKEYYDLELRVPKVLSCQHYICLQCLKNSLLMESLQEPQCPSCKASFSLTTVTPEAFETNGSILAILQNKEKVKLIYCQEHARKRALFCITDQIPICKDCVDNEKHKGHHIQAIKALHQKTVKKKKQLKELLQDNVEKKQEAEQVIGEKFIQIKKLIRDQLLEMRNIIHVKEAEISQNIETAIQAESEYLMNAYNQNIVTLEGKLAEISEGEYDFIITEEPDNCESYLPCGEINNKLEKIITETQETLNMFFKAVASLSFEPTQRNEVSTQTVEEISKILHHEVSTQTVEEISKTLHHETSTQTVQEIQETSQQISQFKKMFRKSGKGIQEPIILKKEALSQLETNSLEIFQDEDNRGFSPQDEMEEELEEKDYQKNQLIEKEIKKIKNQITMEIEAVPQLKLDFSNQSLSNDFLAIFCSDEFWDGTGKNKICHFEANFSASFLTDQKFAKFTQTTLAHMENLTSIMINLAETKISFESLQAFSQALKNCKLKSLVLDCSQTSIGYEGIKSLEDGLSYSIQTLENIEIILDSTDVQGEKFLDVLMGMSQLRHLKLSFENSQISSETVSSVVFCLRFLAQNLESLDLNFNGTKIDAENLESFLNHAIFYLEKLKHFKLSLGETLVSDDILVDFFQSLNLLAPRLVTFELDLHSTGLTHIALKYFCEGALSKMVSLEQLKLDLSQTKITDASLKCMRIPVRKLKSLTLNFNKTNLSDSSLKTFKETNNLNNIENLNIHFEQTQVLQEKPNHINKKSSDHLNSTMKKMVLRRDSNPKALQATIQASSGYSADEKNHPVISDNFKAKNTRVKWDMSTKKKILLELQNVFRTKQGSKPNQTLDLSQLLDSIKNLETKIYSQILRQVLTKNHPYPELIPQDLKEWRKSIRKWIEKFLTISKIPKISKILKVSQISNIPKVLTKTGKSWCNEIVFSKRWLQVYGRKISFEDKLIEILENMSTRSWRIFYERVLKFVKELSCEYKTWKMPVGHRSNWWYDFLSREKAIAKIWKNLPHPREFIDDEFEEKETQDMKNQIMEVEAENLHLHHEEYLQDAEVSSEYLSDAENNPEPVQRSNLGKQYTVVEIPIKRKIICELREAILVQKGYQSDPIKVHMMRLSSLIESLNPEVYNNLLTKVLKKNLPAVSTGAKSLEEWKKKIQLWMRNYVKINRECHQICRKNSSQNIKTEVCSSGLVHWSAWLKKNGKETSFKENVREILQSMSFNP